MTNLYFLEGDNHILLDNEVNDILKENKIDNLITYDMEEVDIKDAIMELDTYGLFNEQKVVYCKNAIFLTTSTSLIKHDIDALERYLNNPNTNNILIISCTKGDSKKKIVKLLKSVSSYKEVSCNYFDFVKKKCQDFKIDKDTIDYFLENTGKDIDRISNELNKLLNFKNVTKEITKHDIDLIVIKKIDNNIFDLIDAIISKNKEKSLTIYLNMINYGEDIMRIFNALVNQIRLIYQVKVLRNLSNDEIASTLNLKNPKQILALRYKIDKYKENDLLKYLHELSIIDEEIKTGKSIDKVVFPMFIAKI